MKGSGTAINSAHHTIAQVEWFLDIEVVRIPVRFGDPTNNFDAVGFCHTRTCASLLLFSVKNVLSFLTDGRPNVRIWYSVPESTVRHMSMVDSSISLYIVF